jgi:hypothetical protein
MNVMTTRASNMTAIAPRVVAWIGRSDLSLSTGER